MIGFYIRLVCAVAMLHCVSLDSAYGQYEGIKLAPGEILIAVNGVPVNQVSSNGTSAPMRSSEAAVASIPRAAVAATAEVIRDAKAYAFAKREADLQASRGQVGHFLGIAPGCNGSGVGSSFSTSKPNHCTFNDKTLVARAFALGRDGKVYWSAHYR
jgi:GTP-dependent phosphoenolpyruvate carboxykinase